MQRTAPAAWPSPWTTTRPLGAVFQPRQCARRFLGGFGNARELPVRSTYRSCCVLRAFINSRQLRSSKGQSLNCCLSCANTLRHISVLMPYLSQVAAVPPLARQPPRHFLHSSSVAAAADLHEIRETEQISDVEAPRRLLYDVSAWHFVARSCVDCVCHQICGQSGDSCCFTCSLLRPAHTAVCV